MAPLTQWPFDGLPSPLVKAHSSATHTTCHTLQLRTETRVSIKHREAATVMKIAIEGCCHGELDAIYSQIAQIEQRSGEKVDLLLVCGDFQAIRNHQDLQCMAVPDKYRQLGQFCKYYTGEKQAPVLTVVIGGNHEASNYFWELYHGGWLAPNIYFLGHAGCIQVNGIRIAGASGIFKPQDFRLGHWERVPYDHGSMRSIYHVREFNVRRLSLLSSPTIFLSHDWPQSIEHHGNLRDLLRRKPYFRDDINKGALGSPPMMNLLRTLQPDWWFSAHLHCRFEAVVSHEARPSSDHAINMNPAEGSDPDEIAIVDDSFTETKPAASSDALMRQGEGSQSKKANETTPVPLNPDEIMLDDDLDDVEAPPPPPPPPKQTRFIALDKCLPKRQFLEVIDVAEPAGLEHERDNDSIPTVTFDPEWLAISRAFHPYMSLSRSQRPYPDEAEARESVKKEMEWIKSHILAGKGVKVNDYQTFVVTAPPPGADIAHEKQQPPHYPNPQTQAFCSMLEIENKIDPPSAQTVASS